MPDVNDQGGRRRVQKVAEAIREVVSMSILTELQDPRVRDVTVTGVEASRDLRYAKVMVSVMGDETRQNLTLRGLQSAAGFLQSKIADRIDLRYTPRLTFVLDQGVKRSISVAEILREVLPVKSRRLMLNLMPANPLLARMSPTRMLPVRASPRPTTRPPHSNRTATLTPE